MPGNLRCRFCQNEDVSHLPAGRELEPAVLADVFLEIQMMGCHNLNLVTPSHVVPQIFAGLTIAAAGGLRLPVVYNTGGYDAGETLALLDGVVDVYMPDVKLLDPDLAQRYLTASDYPDVVRDALTEMHRQVGDLVTDVDDLAVHGLLVRHLVMPGLVAESARVFAFLSTLSRDTFVNVMDQYRPCAEAARVHGNVDYAGDGAGRSHSRDAVDDPRCPADLDPIARRVGRDEFATALGAARAAGLRRAARSP